MTQVDAAKRPSIEDCNGIGLRPCPSVHVGRGEWLPMRRLATSDRRAASNQTLPPKEVSARGKRKHTAVEVLVKKAFSFSEIEIMGRRSVGV